MSNSETNSSAQNKRKDSPEEAQKASEWLAEVCRLLEIPEDVQRANVKGVLDLTSAVAHNKSRPAAAGREGGSPDLFSDAISSRLQLIAEAAGKDSGRPSE